MTTASGISVVIPAYNGGRDLSRAVRSAARQSHAPMEIIVVDDGSTDGSCDHLCEIASQVRVLRQDNRGTAAARNTGVAAAQGAHVALLDQDDQWDERKLEKQIDRMVPGVAVVHAGARFVNASGRVTSVELPVPGLTNHALKRWCVMLQSTALIRVAALQAVGPFDEALSAADDWDMWIRLAERFTFAEVQEVLTTVQVHAHNQSHDPERMLRSAERLIAKHRRESAACAECLSALQAAARRNRQEYYRRARGRARELAASGAPMASVMWTLRGLRVHPGALVDSLRHHAEVIQARRCARSS